MDNRQRRELDRHITGNYGEDQFRNERESDVDDVGNAVHTRSKMSPDDGALAEPSGQHTPGPWHYRPTMLGHPNNRINPIVTSEFDGIEGHGHYICRVGWKGSTIAGMTSNTADSFAEAEANARLIAAAPDLLLALEETARAAHWQECKQTAPIQDCGTLRCQRASAAIKKARS